MKTRSLSGPLFLITIGVLWLLGIAKAFPLQNLWALLHLLPYFLIAIGASLLVRGLWYPGGVILSVLVAAGIILAVLFAPQLGWDIVPSWAMDWNIGENFGGGVTGSGNVISETRPVQGISSVLVSYPSDVSITQGEVESLTIETDDNLMPQLSTQVVNGRLEIVNTESDFNKRVSPTEGVQINLTVKDLSSIIVSTAGSVNIKGLEVDSLDFTISGISSVTLEDVKLDSLKYVISGVGNTTADGEVGNLNLTMSGVGGFEGENLAVQSANAVLSGAGSATIWVIEELTARISGAGSLNYYGDPVILSKNVSGVGSINHEGDK